MRDIYRDVSCPWLSFDERMDLRAAFAKARTYSGACDAAFRLRMAIGVECAAFRVSINQQFNRSAS